MFKLTITNSKPIMESNDVPENDSITSILDNFFQGVEYSKKSDMSVMSLLENSLRYSLPIKFDYRNNNLGAEVEKLSKFVQEEQRRPAALLHPLVQILEMYGGDVPLGIRVTDTTKPEYLHESRVFDYVMTLYQNGYIPTRFMETYKSELTSSVCETVYDMIGLSQEESKSVSENTLVLASDSSTYVRNPFPNDIILEAIFQSIQKEDPQTSATPEEVECLTMDFLEDENLQGLSGSCKSVYLELCGLVKEVYDNRMNIDTYYDIIRLIRVFQSTYVRYPTDMLTNVGKLLTIYLWDMMEVSKQHGNVELFRLLLDLSTSLVRDIGSFDNISVLMANNTDEVYAKILAQWSISTCSIFDKKIEGLRNCMGADPEECFRGMEIGGKGDVGVYSCRTTRLQDPDTARDLLESFQVLQDGTIKVTVEKKSTYMDEYASNHRLLIANRKAGNWEGVKYNIVYHLILIDNIEKNVLHNRKVTKGSDLYEDAMKARSFAKNDVSTYLPEVRQHCKNFDINKFYKQVKADQATISINGVETVTGVKKIIKSILL